MTKTPMLSQKCDKWRIWPLPRIQLVSFLATYAWSGCQYYIVGTHLCIVQRSVSLMAFIHLWMHAYIPVAQIVLLIGGPLHILTQAMSNTCIHRSCHWNVHESKWNFQYKQIGLGFQVNQWHHQGRLRNISQFVIYTTSCEMPSGGALQTRELDRIVFFTYWWFRIWFSRHHVIKTHQHHVYISFVPLN